MKINSKTIVFALALTGAAFAPRAQAQTAWDTQWKDDFQNGLTFQNDGWMDDRVNGGATTVAATTLGAEQNSTTVWGGSFNHVLKMWLNAGQSTYSNGNYRARCEIQKYKVAFNNDEPLQERTYSFDVLIPKTWPADPDSKNIIIAQWHPNLGFDGWAPNPALSFTLNPIPTADDPARVKLTISSIIPSYEGTSHVTTPVQHYSETASRGVWQRFWIYVKWAPDERGQIEVRRGYSSFNSPSSGTRLFQYRGATTGDMFPSDPTKAGGFNFNKWGLYIGAVPSNYSQKAQKTIYFDNVLISKVASQRVPQ